MDGNSVSYNNFVTGSSILSYQDVINEPYDRIHAILFDLSNKKAYESLYNDLTNYDITYYENIIDELEKFIDIEYFRQQKLIYDNKQVLSYEEKELKRLINELYYVLSLHIKHYHELRLYNINYYKDKQYRYKILINLIETECLASYEDFKKYISIIEIKGPEYYSPSKVIWQTKTYPFIKFSINTDEHKYNTNLNDKFWLKDYGEMSLSYWWVNPIEILNKKLSENASFTQKLDGYEITYIDYVNDKVTLYNRLTDSTIIKKLQDLNPSIVISDSYSLENTFTSLYLE